MKSKQLTSMLTGLPTYFGGKRQLNHRMFSALSQAVAPTRWAEMTFIDAFMGGAAVSLQAKAYGFKMVQANDISDRSKILADAFLTNTKVKLSKEDVLTAMRVLQKDKHLGFVETNYSPSVFSSRHAETLDRLFSGAQTVSCPHKRGLLLTLFWRLATQFVCFPTSLGTSNRPYAEALDGLRAWDTLNPKRYRDGTLERLLLPPLKGLEKHRKVINQSVFGGAPACFSQLDGLEFVRNTQGDILYADPPYPGTLSYEKSNLVLDSLLKGQFLEPVQAVSPFTKSVEALDLLFESARHIPIWMLSYGNKHITCEELVAKVKQHAPNRTVEGHAFNYQHLAHVSKNTNNQELLILAY